MEAALLANMFSFGGATTRPLKKQQSQKEGKSSDKKRKEKDVSEEPRGNTPADRSQSEEPVEKKARSERSSKTSNGTETSANGTENENESEKEKAVEKKFYIPFKKRRAPFTKSDSESESESEAEVEQKRSKNVIGTDTESDADADSTSPAAKSSTHKIVVKRKKKQEQNQTEPAPLSALLNLHGAKGADTYSESSGDSDDWFAQTSKEHDNMFKHKKLEGKKKKKPKGRTGRAGRTSFSSKSGKKSKATGKPAAPSSSSSFRQSPSVKKRSVMARPTSSSTSSDVDSEDEITYPTNLGDKADFYTKQHDRDLELQCDEHERVILPARYNRRLASYQRDGVIWLFQRLSRNEGCLLGDDMGLGKTIQMICLLVAAYSKTGVKRKDKECWKRRVALIRQQVDLPVKDKQLIHPTSKFELNRNLSPTLIVVPASLISNWCNEISKWGYFEVRNFRKKEDRKSILEDARNGLVEVIIMSYDMMRIYAGELNELDLEMIVFDEVHNLKSDRSERTAAARELQRCRRKIGLTGTPIQNKLEELWVICDLLVPDLGSWNFFFAEFAQIINRGQTQDASPSEKKLAANKQRKLYRLLDNFMLRRTKQSEPELRKELKTKKEQIIMCNMEEPQRTAYERLINGHEVTDLTSWRLQVQTVLGLADGSIEPERYPYGITDGVVWSNQHPEDMMCNGCPYSCLVFPLINYLYKIATHLDLVRVDLTEKEEVQAKQRKFAEWLFDTNDPVQLERQDKFTHSKRDYVNCGKLKALVKLLALWKKSDNNKVLLFSRSTKVLDIIQHLMVYCQYMYCRLDGSTAPGERQKIVDEFNTDKNMFVFLLSIKAGGTGLNLASANIVVIFDAEWNPSFDMQAQDRAFRLGQKQDVKVFRFISVGTIEELVYLRQLHKLERANLIDSKLIKGDTFVLSDLYGIPSLFSYNWDGFGNTIQRRNKELHGQEEAFFILEDDANMEAIQEARKRKMRLDDDLSDVLGFKSKAPSKSPSKAKASKAPASPATPATVSGDESEGEAEFEPNSVRVFDVNDEPLPEPGTYITASQLDEAEVLGEVGNVQKAAKLDAAVVELHPSQYLEDEQALAPPVLIVPVKGEADVSASKVSVKEEDAIGSIKEEATVFARKVSVKEEDATGFIKGETTVSARKVSVKEELVTVPAKVQEEVATADDEEDEDLRSGAEW